MRECIELIRISEEDLAKYRELVHVAQNAPVMTLRSDLPTFSETAWKNVQYFMKDMAEKYNYPYDKHVINMKNGDILTIKEAQQMEKKEK